MQPDPATAVAIVLAAGAGRRLGAEEPKAFLPIGGRPILAVATGAAAASPAVGSVVVAAPAGWEDRARGCVEGCGVPVVVVTGGSTRRASVLAALEVLPPETRVVAIHDAARPFAPPDLFTAVIAGVSERTPGVVPVAPVTDTVKHVVDGMVVRTLDRERLGLAQTPQAFDVAVLRAAHGRAASSAAALTDDAAALEHDGIAVAAIPGDPSNVKITTLFDLANADARMGGVMGEASPRVGLGFDVHPWATDDRALWLGSVRFEEERGLEGHSDGDAVCHAIADAMLGAAALGDVGQHFPESDPGLEGIDGATLLTRTVALLSAEGLTFRSCDVTVICERPVVAPRRDEMRARLAQVLGAHLGAVSVKATRPEGLGLSGDGVGCMAVVLIA